MRKDADSDANQPTEIMSRQRSPEYECTIDFSPMLPHELAGYLLAELRHPSLHQFDAERLANFMNTRLLTRDGNPASLSTNIREFIDSSKIFSSPGLYDQKVDRDDVFAYLVTSLQETKNELEHSPQRKVIMSLLDFRGSFLVHTTAEDSEWKELVVRLLA